MVALSIFTVAQATWFDFKVLARSPGLLDSLAAADNSTSTAEETKPAASASAAPSPDTTTAKAPETTTKAPDKTTTEQTKAPDPTTTPAAGNTTPTAAAPTTPSGGQTTPNPGPAQTTSAGKPTNTHTTLVKTTSDGKTMEVPLTTTEFSPEPTTAKPFTTVFTHTITMSDGKTSAVETQSVVTPGLSQGQTNSDDKGMPESTKNTIIGVCVGVGGAIILAAAGVLIWRLRAKRRDQDDGEDLVNYGAGTSQFNNAGPEKNEPGSVSGRSPFQSTLESYHAPSSNTGTNF
jgi:hypothetical protein